MRDKFGLTAGETNVALIDATGRLRLRINGALDQAAIDRLVKGVQAVRYEAVK